MPKIEMLNFNEFPPVEAELWKSKIINELKGRSFESICSVTSDDIKIAPFYSQRNLESESFFKNSYTEENSIKNSVLLREIIFLNDEEFAIEEINYAIKGGVNSILLIGNPTVISKRNNLFSNKNVNFSFHLNTGISSFLESCSLWFTKTDNNLFSLEDDPISFLIQNGNWANSQGEDLNELAKVVNFKYQKKDCFQKCIHINASVYHNSGASFVQEIAYAIAHANEYISFFLEKNFILEEILPKIHFTFSVGTDYFNEISKLRAFKILWSNLIHSYNPDMANNLCYINVETSARYHSIIDEHTNILRTTTQAMSAIIGGCNSLYILPFNQLRKAKMFSKRIARNIGNILIHEASINGKSNPANGSYYLEYLTSEYSKAAWETFKDIEKNGGLIQSLYSNKIQEAIKFSREKEIKEFKEGKHVLVGVNKYTGNNETKDEEIRPINQGNNKTEINPLKEFRLASFI